MKTLASLILLIPLWAQDASPPADSQSSAAAPAAAQDQSKPAPDAAAQQAPASQTQTAQAPAAPAPATPPAPAAATDNWLQGSIQLGYRWIPNIDGSYDAYRSVINLGQGPKLMDADFTLLNPSKRFFDRADIHASSWGDPYNTLRADVEKDGLYRLTVDYRNIAYSTFFLPTPIPHSIKESCWIKTPPTPGSEPWMCNSTCT